MNGLEFASSIITALLWPCAFVIIALVYRRHVPEFLGRVKSASVGPVSFELAERVKAASEASPAPVSAEGRSTATERLQRNAGVLSGASILWVDDNPEGNASIASVFRAGGAVVRTATTTDAALREIRVRKPDVLISDMTRGGDGQAGLELARQAVQIDRRLAPVFFVSQLQPGRPADSHGITNRVDELIHLVLDALERRPVVGRQAS